MSSSHSFLMSIVLGVVAVSAEPGRHRRRLPRHDMRLAIKHPDYCYPNAFVPFVTSSFCLLSLRKSHSEVLFL